MLSQPGVAPTARDTIRCSGGSVTPGRPGERRWRWQRSSASVPHSLSLGSPTAGSSCPSCDSAGATIPNQGAQANRPPMSLALGGSGPDDPAAWYPPYLHSNQDHP